MFPRHRIPLVALLVLLSAAAFAQDEDNSGNLEGDLEQVPQAYAEAYLAPLTNAFGANQNTALYHTAHIGGTGLTFGVALKFMGAHMSEEDQTFRTVVEVDDVGDFLGIDDFHDSGLIVMEGPSVIGADGEGDEGSITGYVNGVPVHSEQTITGLLNTRWIPLATPEVAIGGIAGLKATVRWLPEIDLDDYGKSKYFGWGLQWSPNHFMPTLPLDLSVGFFKQSLDAGTIIQTDAHSFFVAASKPFGLATVYGGFATEKSEMDVSYTYIVDEDDPASEEVEVAFTVESIMTKRFTVGTTLNLGVKLYAEANFGELSVYSAGLVFGM